MAKNHWHSAGNTKRSEAYKYGYKSGLEHTVAEQIKIFEFLKSKSNYIIFK